jgi:acyl carrier protein
VEYVGRADNQVKVRGHRIELGEVEAALSAHASVAECVVAVKGEESDKRLVAYVVAREGEAVNTAGLREHLTQRLPHYMVPSAFVLLDELPLTRNGKVDRRALPEPDGGGINLADKYVAPRTAAEEQLAAIWQEVLGVGRVGVHDNFFELGGHSLLATQLASRFRDVFQTELPLRNLFEEPTVAGLVSLLGLEQGGAGGASTAGKAIERRKNKTVDELLLELDDTEDGYISLAGLN